MEGPLPEMKVVRGVTGWRTEREEGSVRVDMHFHTNCSDSYTDAVSLMRLARRRCTGVAVTDHNLIGTLRRLDLDDPDVMVIPGIEVSTSDGPHILVYFYEFDELEEFWEREIRPRLPPCPWLALRDCGTADLLDLLEGRGCVVSAAHPMGYLGSDKGLEACIARGRIPEGLARRLDAYEVLCSGMTRAGNLAAAQAADRHGLAYTGGTDGHLLSELGNVVTVCDASDRHGFLDGVAAGRATVIGREKTVPEKLRTGSASFSKFVTHAPSSVYTKMTRSTGMAARRRR